MLLFIAAFRYERCAAGFSVVNWRRCAWVKKPGAFNRMHYALLLLNAAVFMLLLRLFFRRRSRRHALQNV